MVNNPILLHEPDDRKSNIFILTFLWTGVQGALQNLLDKNIDFTDILVANIKQMNLIDIVQFCNLLNKSINHRLNPTLLKLITDTFEDRCKLQTDDMAKTLSLMLYTYLKLAGDQADERFIKFVLL